MFEAKWVIVVIGVAMAIVIIVSMSIYLSSGKNEEFDLGDGNDIINA